MLFFQVGSSTLEYKRDTDLRQKYVSIKQDLMLYLARDRVCSCILQDIHFASEFGTFSVNVGANLTGFPIIPFYNLLRPTQIDVTVPHHVPNV